MAKLTQKTVAAFFSPRRKRTTRVNRKLKEAEPVFSDDSSSEDDPAHFALEPKSQLLDLAESPPRYITSSSSSDGDQQSSFRPARKLVRRSEASSSQGPASAQDPVRKASTSKAAANAPAKTAARAQWESKKGKGLGKEKDVSRPSTRAGKWTDDEDEYAVDREAAAEIDNDWLVTDGSPAPTSKGKGRATSGAAVQPSAPKLSPTVFKQLKSTTMSVTPAVTATAGSDDPDGGLKPLRSPHAAQSEALAAPLSAVRAKTSTVEDLLDAAVGSQISKAVDARSTSIKPEGLSDALDDSDGSVLIMDTPPPESPPRLRSDKMVDPPASVEKARPLPGRSVVVRKAVKPPLRAASPSPSPSVSPQPKPTRAASALQRSQHLQDRTKQGTRSSPRVGSSRRQPSEDESSDQRVVRSSTTRERAQKPSVLSSSEASTSDAPSTSRVQSSQLASKRRKALGKRKATPISSNFEEDEDGLIGDDDSEEDRRRKARVSKTRPGSQTAKRRKRPLDSSGENESEEEEEQRRRKRKKQRRLTQRRAMVESQDEEGTDSEPDDLEDDAGRLLTIESRMRTGTERAGTKELARRAQLEKLKKRKQQRKSGVTSLITEDEEEGSEEEQPYTKIWGRDSRGRYATEDDEEFMEAFIEEDDEEIDQLDLPAAFRSDASQPMELNFNVVIQWHVHAIVKGRQWAKKATRDSYFQAPLHRLRDHLTSTRNSGITSQVWPAHFKKALDRFPVFEGYTIKGNSTPCDACQNPKRPATRKIELSGKRFDPVTFERIAYDSEESEDDGLKGLDSEFNCGRYCFHRARVYHAMTHWEDDIHEWLCDTIEQLPDEEDERPGTAAIRIDGGLHKISSLPSKNDPDRIVEWLSKKVRWVTSQWSKLKELIESGRNLDAEYRRWES